MEKHNLLGRGNNASDICTLKIKRLKLWLTQFPNKKTNTSWADSRQKMLRTYHSRYIVKPINKLHTVR